MSDFFNENFMRAGAARTIVNWQPKPLNILIVR